MELSWKIENDCIFFWSSFSYLFREGLELEEEAGKEGVDDNDDDDDDDDGDDENEGDDGAKGPEAVWLITDTWAIILLSLK